MAKIKYMTIEPSEILYGAGFQFMTASQRGVYLTLILYLFCAGGRMKLDLERMAAICRCDDFENVWRQIKDGFLIKDDTISHKIAAKALARAKRSYKAKHLAGVKGAKKRWRRDEIS